MDVATVTLDEVLRASQARSASLVPETAGYLALAVGDGASRLPFRVEDRAVKLTTEGSVLVDRGKEVVGPEEAGRVLRDMLARLLDSSVGSMPCLASAARPRAESERGMEAVIEELESALIPVNRAAARRALARLARETMRAKQTGRMRRRAKSHRSRKGPKPAPEVEIPIIVDLMEPEAVEPEPAYRPAPEVELAGHAAPEAESAHVPAAEPAPAELVAALPAPAELVAAQPAPAELVEAADPAELVEAAEPEPTPTVFEDGLVTFEQSEDELEKDLVALAEADADVALLDAQLADPTILQVTTAEVEALVPPAPRLPRDEAFQTFEIAASEDRPKRARRSSRPAPEADIDSGRKSDVDDLLRSFGESKLGAGELREVAAELKSMAGLDVTPPPPETAPHTIVMRTLPEADPPPVIDAPPLVVSQSRMGRVARAGMALKLTLLVLGIATTGLIWRYYPAIFAGSESPIVGDSQPSTP